MLKLEIKKGYKTPFHTFYDVCFGVTMGTTELRNEWKSLSQRWDMIEAAVRVLLRSTYFAWLAGVLFLFLLLWCYCLITFQRYKFGMRK